jgi:hypothetical protein
MFEFLFGFVLGVWAGQSMPLPSMGQYVQGYFTPKVEQTVVENKEEEEKPLFTGKMPTVATVDP